MAVGANEVRVGHVQARGPARVQELDRLADETDAVDVSEHDRILDVFASWLVREIEEVFCSVSRRPVNDVGTTRVALRVDDVAADSLRRARRGTGQGDVDPKGARGIAH